LETAVVANTAKVTNYNQTLADINALDVTELGTVTSGNLANTAITGISHTTSVVDTAGQNWSGVTYTDPDAVGSSPTAKIYPDGTVVGSTANGNYTKYPNGDLTCSYMHFTQVTSNTVGGGFYYAPEVSVTFPMEFIAVPTGWNPYVHRNSSSGSDQGWWWAILTAGNVVTTTGCTDIRLISNYTSGGSYVTGSIGYEASGRWKA
jgi:hypothetical protein